jgi:Fic family protein
LPESYSEEDVRDKTEAVFVHVFRAYPTAPSPYYISMASWRVAKEDMSFNPNFTITNRMTQAITRIERARGFLEAAQLSADWVREVGEQALILEAHHTTHIEGTRLTLDQAGRLWKGEAVPEADPDDARELLNYRTAFEFVSEWLDSGDPITEGMIREIHR